MVDRYWEIEECPNEVHQAHIMPGGFSPSLEFGRGSRGLTRKSERVELKLDY